MDVPVYVEQEVIDLRICLMDRLYQSSVVLRNRYVAIKRSLMD